MSQLPELCNTVSGGVSRDPGARMKYFTLVIDLRKEYAKKKKLQGKQETVICNSLLQYKVGLEVCKVNEAL